MKKKLQTNIAVNDQYDTTLC